MVPNWESWCRLCAREDPTNIHLKNELESTYLDAITKHFSIDINIDDWPQTICTRCHQYIMEFLNFVHKTNKVQTMFAEFFKNHDELDLQQLRTKFELYELGDVKLKISDPKPNIGEFEFIGEEMLSTPLIKTENIEEEDCNVSDKEWQHELDDDSSEDDESIMLTTKCEEEDEGSKERPKLKKRGRPRKTPETFSCSTCQKQFCSYPKYARHMQQEHGITADPLPYICSQCNKSFSTQKACNKHEITHQSAEQKLTTCPYCEKEYKKNKLRGHIREIHVGEKPFVCDDCDKAYTTFGNLKEHKLTHSEDRPFKCRYCEKGFKNKPRLRTHEDTHNDTNYICTSCGLQLNTRRTLKMHMLVHSDQKQHKCDFCGKEYKRAKNLKIHLIMHTGLKSYMCTFCDKTFTSNANCRIHMKKVHPIELAAMEATGTKIRNSNIPKLKDLRAVISKKSIVQESTGTMEFGSTDNILSMNGGLKPLKVDNHDNQATSKEEQPTNQATIFHPIELVSMEATGTQIINSNIPILEDLQTVISKKSIVQDSMGAMEFGSTVGTISMSGDLKPSKVDNHGNQATILPTSKEEQLSNQQENSYLVNNRMDYGQLHAS